MPPLTKWILPAWIAGESDLGDHRQPCKAGTLSVGSPRTLLHDASELWLKCRQYITQARCNVSAELDFHCLLAGSHSLLPFAPHAPTAPNNHSHTGLLQISSLALLQQGKLGAASAQLCAWLKQGGQRTEEACTAVRSFLVALHAHVGPAANTGGTSAAMTANDTAIAAAGVQVQDGRARGAAAARGCSAEERAEAVQQVAAAAAEHCRTDPAVALEVAMQLLADPVSGWRVFQVAAVAAPQALTCLGLSGLLVLIHNASAANTQQNRAFGRLPPAH